MGYRAAWDTVVRAVKDSVACGIPCCVGQHAGCNTMPDAIPCQVGTMPTMPCGVPDTTRGVYRAVSCAGRRGVGARARLHWRGAAHHHAVGRRREPRVLRFCRRVSPAAASACVPASVHPCVRARWHACAPSCVRVRACVRARERAYECMCAPVCVSVRARVCVYACRRVYAPASALARKCVR